MSAHTLELQAGGTPALRHRRKKNVDGFAGGGGFSSGADEPMRTIVAGGTHHSVVAPVIVRNQTTDQSQPARSIEEPLGAVVAHGANPSIAAVSIIPRYGEREGQEPRCRSAEEPMASIVPTGNGAQVVGTFLAQNNAGFYSGDGRPMDAPMSTILNEGANQSVCAVSLAKIGNGESNTPLDAPLQTVCSGGLHHGVVGVSLGTTNNSREPNYGADEPAHSIVADGARHAIYAGSIQRDFGQSVGSGLDEPIGAITADRGGHAALIGSTVDTGCDLEGRGPTRCYDVAAFISKYYGQGIGQEAGEPLDTITCKDRFGLVTVTLETRTEVHGPHGVWIVLEAGTYTLYDIGMRMLRARELYRAQGFRDGYVIDRGADGRKLTETEQVRMCGNSVCPPVAKAIVRANASHMLVRQEWVA